MCNSNAALAATLALISLATLVLVTLILWLREDTALLNALMLEFIEATAALRSCPLKLTLPPTYRFPVIPAPPVIFNAH